MVEITVKTNKREELVDITYEVKEALEEELDENGSTNYSACLVYTSHATAGIIINENYDPSVCEDILTYLREQIPQGKWKHDKIDNNADSHIKSSIVGPGQTIPLNSESGELHLGTWQGIALAEFDGPKSRKVIIKALN